MAGGRPTKMTKEAIAKLEEVFALGGTDLEACFYADISKDVLYDYEKLHPEFTDRKFALKEQPVLKARRTVVAALAKPADAQWYLERRKKLEFSQRQELTGADGKDLPTPILGAATMNVPTDHGTTPHTKTQ